MCPHSAKLRDRSRRCKTKMERFRTQALTHTHILTRTRQEIFTIGSKTKARRRDSSCEDRHTHILTTVILRDLAPSPVLPLDVQEPDFPGEYRNQFLGCATACTPARCALGRKEGRCSEMLHPSTYVVEETRR